MSSDLPGYFKLTGKFNIHRLIPASLVKFAAMMKRSFSSDSSEDKIILKRMIRESDERFIRWAIDAVVKWENKSLPFDYTHIHGTRDEVFPIYFTKPTDIIAKGGHLMVMDRAKEINQIIERSLLALK
jgi:pimeloyl-ACP methyl ester carboxylesterase